MREPDLAVAMMALHDDLQRTFFAHQVALLDRDFVRAARELASYRTHLEAHAADEEALVLPRYRELGGDATDAPVKLFVGEHDKLRTFLADFTVRVAALCERADDARLLELFDRQATFKNLMWHHDLRERNLLYPFLVARLSREEQERVLAGRSFAG